MSGIGASMEFLLVVGFLLLPPLVLWRCKRFCENHPSTIPFRTVPVGCLTMFVAAALFESALHWLFQTVLERNIPHAVSSWVGPVSELLAIVLGLAVIHFLSKRLERGGKTPRKWLFPAVFAGLAAIIAALSVLFAVFGFPPSFDKESASWSTIFLPKIQECPIAFEQRPSHPFLAEYDYRIRLGERDNSACFRLWPNTGGRTYLNVYRVSDDKLLLKDKDVSYLVDISRKQVYLIGCEREDDGSKSEIRSAIPLSEKPFTTMDNDTVFFTDGTSSEAIPYDLDLRSCEYIGCIMDYSFYTPDEQPEGEGHPRYRTNNSTQDE